jgi:hypothetical protein
MQKRLLFLVTAILVIAGTPASAQDPSASPGAGSRHVSTGLDATSDLTPEWDLPLSWEVFDDWAVLKNGSDPPEGMGSALWLVAGVFKDPCQWDTQSGIVSLGAAPTVDETVAAIAAQPSRGASAVTDAELAGYTGKHLVVSVPADVVLSDCRGGQFRSWVGRDGGIRYHQGPGQIDELWVLDVDGTTVTVVAAYFPATSEADRAELAAVLDSLRIVDPSSAPSTEASSAP